MYTAEVSHPDMRSVTSAFYPVFLSVGLCYGFLIGYVYEMYRTICILMLVPAILFFGASIHIPESPYWLVRQGRLSEAKASLQKLRGEDFDICPEITEIIQKNDQKDSRAKQDKRPSILDWKFFYPLLKVNSLVILQEMGGSNVLAHYMSMIFLKVGSSTNPHFSPVIVASTKILFGVLGATLLRNCKRRTVLLTFLSISAVSLLSLGLFSFENVIQEKTARKTALPLKDDQVREVVSKVKRDTTGISNIRLKSISEKPYRSQIRSDPFRSQEDQVPTTSGLWEKISTFIPIISVMAVQASETIAFVPILHLSLPAESFPTETRSAGCGLSGIAVALTRFSLLKAFPPLVEQVPFHSLMWAFAMFTLLALAASYFMLPENSGESLSKTEEKFYIKSNEQTPTLSPTLEAISYQVEVEMSAMIHENEGVDEDGSRQSSLFL